MTRVLVVDDEPQILRGLGTNLRARGYEVDTAPDGERALTIAATTLPDVVILDLGLPGIDGVEVIRGLRTWTRTPIIVLSARDQERDKVEALDAGADDYVEKPFGMNELLARLRAAERRATPAGEAAVVETDAFTVDLAAKKVASADGNEVHLTPTEWGLVESLVYNRNRQAADVRLFEVGGVFSQARGERTAVGWVLTGSRGEHWSGSAGPLTFADTRGIADLIASTAGVAIDVAPGEDLPWLARGQRARLVDPTGVEVGWIGRLSIPALDGDAVFAGEVDLGALGGFSTAPRRIAALARHPSIVRDLSILVSERLPAADVRGTIRANAPPTLVDVREFDRYQGKGVPDGQVSVSVRLTFRAPDRTLTDAEAQQAVEAIVAALRTRHDAVLRGATGRISAE